MAVVSLLPLVLMTSASRPDDTGGTAGGRCGVSWRPHGHGRYRVRRRRDSFRQGCLRIPIVQFVRLYLIPHLPLISMIQGGHPLLTQALPLQAWASLCSHQRCSTRALVDPLCTRLQMSTVVRSWVYMRAHKYHGTSRHAFVHSYVVW